jgi:hypothetical protein
MRRWPQVGSAHMLTVFVLLGTAQLECAAQPPRGTAPATGGTGPSIVIEALSRGKGVPEPTFEALTKARSLLQGLQEQDKVVRLDETRLGLEGETRLCAEFKDRAAASEAIEQLRSIARTVELLNVVEKPCGSR